jgi:hypothetical protein
MHIEDSRLRAYLDEELPDAERLTIAQHLESCETCSARLAEIQERAKFVGERLGSLETPQLGAAATGAAWSRMQDRMAVQDRPGRVRRSPWRPRWSLRWALGGMVVLLAASMAFAPVRAWAGQFLSLFRVQQIAVLPVDVTNLSQLSGDTPITEQIAKMLSSSTTMERKPQKPELVSSVQQANQAAGFQVRLPTSRSDAPQLLIQSGEAFSLKIDRARAQALLDELAPEKVELPASVDGAVVQVNIPASVTAGYGDCPGIETGFEGMSIDAGSPVGRFANCVLLAELPSPTVSTPPDLDVQKLAEIGLEMTGMTPAQAAAYSNTVDWASTLVIPIPKNGATYKTVQVDGVTGYLIERPVDDAPQYALVWTKKGIIYAIGGLGSNTQQAMDMANSLH